MSEFGMTFQTVRKIVKDTDNTIKQQAAILDELDPKVDTLEKRFASSGNA